MTSSSCNSSYNPPYVLIDGIRYYSDRFYINTPVGLPFYPTTTPSHNPNLHHKTTENNKNYHHETSSNSAINESSSSPPPPPPLLDRAKVISNLDLVAVIAGTYTLDPDWLKYELPTLFPPPSLDPSTTSLKKDEKLNSGIPSLVLHGHKGLKYQVKEANRQRSSSSATTLLKSSSSPSTVSSMKHDSHVSLKPGTPLKKQSRSQSERYAKYIEQEYQEWIGDHDDSHNGKNTSASTRLSLDSSNGASTPRSRPSTSDSTPYCSTSASSVTNTSTKFKKSSKQKSKKSRVKRVVKVKRIKKRNKNQQMRPLHDFKVEQMDSGAQVFVLIDDNDDDDDDKDVKKENKKQAVVCDMNIEMNGHVKDNKNNHPTKVSNSSVNKTIGLIRSTACSGNKPSPRSRKKQKLKCPKSIKQKDEQEHGKIERLAAKHGKKLFQSPLFSAKDCEDTDCEEDAYDCTNKKVKWEDEEEKALAITKADSDGIQPMKCTSSVAVKIEDKDVPPPEDGWMGNANALKCEDLNESTESEMVDTLDHHNLGLFGDNVFLTQVLPAYLPSSSSSSSSSFRAPSSRQRQSCSNSPVSTKPSSSSTKHNQNEDVIVIIDDSSDDEKVNPTEQTYLEQCKKEESVPIHNHINHSKQPLNIKGVDAQTIARRQACLGVHHPKFLLLFERRGSIVVIISTSNLSRPTTTDASWIQRFEPRQDETLPFTDANNVNDFGQVLCDFLQRQSDAAVEAQMLPLEFLQRFVINGDENENNRKQLKSLQDLQYHYHFERSEVHLISTVPGNFSFDDIKYGCTTNINRKHRRKQQILYGPQRVAQILNTLQSSISSNQLKRLNKENSHSKEKTHSSSLPWLPRGVMSPSDRLVMQTTSIGGNWKGECLERLARLYLGWDQRTKSNNDNHSTSNDGAALDSVRIIWPPQYFMNNVNAGLKRACENMKHYNHQQSTMPKSDYSEGEWDLFNGPCCFSTKAFNGTDLECLSRMSLYETCQEVMPWVLSPHIKTFARVLHSDCDDSEDDYHEDNVCEHHDLAWIMLTSACLSRGAQGSVKRKNTGTSNATNGDYGHFSNFELGVLFTSRLQGNSQSDRLYTSYPQQGDYHPSIPSKSTSSIASTSHDMACSSTTTTRVYNGKEYHPNIVHLPIPFKLDSTSYQPDPDDADFVVTPFFHEIDGKHKVCGQMRLTPLGKRIAMEPRYSS